MKNSKSWLAVFLLSLMAALSARIELASSQDEHRAQEEQSPSRAKKADAAQIELWIAELAVDDYQSRNSASLRLLENRDVAFKPVLLSALSSNTKFAVAAECLNLLDKWLRDFDAPLHERTRQLLKEHRGEANRSKRSETLVRQLLDEGYDCTEAHAVVLISMMGASIHWSEDESHFLLRSFGNCSREEGDSLWPLRMIHSDTMVLFEAQHTVDDFTVRNMATAPGLRRLFCPKMTEQQVTMLGESQSLKELFLRRVIDEEGTLKALAKIPSLELLSFEPEQPVDMLRHLHLFPALISIYTNRQNISDPKVLDYLAACSQLEVLDLVSFDMPSENFQDMGRFKNVKSLELPWRVDDDLVKSIAEMPSLEAIEIKKSIITDAAAPYIAKHKNLRKLSIEHSFITDASCEHFAKLTSLEELLLDGTFVTPAGVALIEKANPGLEVKGWITAAHDPAYVEALQQLQLVGCTVQPNFGVSFERDGNGKAILPYTRSPGCDVFFTLTDDKNTNDRFTQFAKRVSDLGILKITGCNDAFATQLLQLPATAEVFFFKSEITDETLGKLKARFKTAGVSK